MLVLPSFLLALSAVQGVRAHTMFSKLFIDGQDQGDGFCVRQPSDPAKSTFPVENLASDDMACGANGQVGVARVCSASSGSSLTFEWRASPSDASAGIIAPSHKGPCAVYLKKVSSAVSDTATGDGWFKIWDEGYDEDAGLWCTEKLIANNGHMSVSLPENLAGGDYLVRPELLALHSADIGDPQFYIGCAQVFVSSTGNIGPKDTVSIPGYVETGSAPVSFNIWEQPMALPYPMPGPVVFTPVEQQSVDTESKVVQTDGFTPENCVVQNANWCGIELDKYSTEDGCWNATDACWKQSDECYDAAPPSGYSGCTIWQAKCQNMQDQCNAKNFNGPPDYMKNLTPKPTESVSLPAAAAPQYTNAVSVASASTPVAQSSEEVTAVNNMAASTPTTFAVTTSSANQTTATSATPSEAQPATTAAPAVNVETEVLTTTVDDVATVVQYVTAKPKHRQHARHLSLHQHGHRAQNLAVGEESN